VSFLVFNGLHDGLRRIGLGRVPGDFSVKVGRRAWHFPFGSTLLLTLLASVISHWL
jgi:hypothetical protein